MSYNSNSHKTNKMIQQLSCQISQKDLRLDLTDWLESSSNVTSNSSCFVITVVQRPGARDQQVFPQEYKNMKAACMDGSRLLADIIADCGAQCVTDTDIRNDRFYVTTENNVKITMVLG